MNIIKIFTLLLIVSLNITISGQDLSYSQPGHLFYPELPNPRQTDPGQWAGMKSDVNVSFASSNIRYAKEKVPENGLQKSWKFRAWRGEKVHTQLLVWSRKDIYELTVDRTTLTGKNGVIPAESITVNFVRYTMADDFGGGCADRDLTEDDSSLVADPIDMIDGIGMEPNSVRPVWVSIQVPGNTKPGTYRGKIIVRADKIHELEVELDVSDHLLPPPSEWTYDFDIWQYPAPIARIHGVDLWSDAHFRLMEPYFRYLASAGQKVVTANIIEQPWGLDHVHFDDPSLVKWTLMEDGSWSYDFSLFEKYVSFMKACGISQRINCYTMITWDLSYIYFDEKTDSFQSVKIEPGSEEFKEFWGPMLREFTRFLKMKGWFDQTAIAMDERPLESMQAVISLLHDIDPDWKIALAGDTYHPEIEPYIYDYCLASYLGFEDSVMTKRKQQGKPTTFYTACVEEYPTGYTFSPPAENAFLGWHAAAKGFTGYLFWAYNTWVPNPLQDSRWRRYPAGTLFQFYPGPRTSIRFEKLIEGIQDFEKIRILREEFTQNGNRKGLKKIDKALSYIKIEDLDHISANAMVDNAKSLLDGL